jgi:hypothetical protein
METSIKMTLQKFIEHQKKAIVANFKIRNVSVASPARMKQVKSQRRNSIRGFISKLRLATNPSTSAIIADKVSFEIG